MHILDQIVVYTQNVIAQRKNVTSLEAMKAAAYSATYPTRSLKAKLTDPKPHVIAEFKRKSPSKPDINIQADPVEMAREYTKGGASAMSVLTEPGFFSGSMADLVSIRGNVDLPLLRKDFIIDAYQVYEAKAAGANLILLIGRILSKQQIADLCGLAHELGMEVLFEIHHLEEWQPAEDSEVDFLGVNCRDLTRFQTNLDLLLDLSKDLPKGIPWVAESGISSPEDVHNLRKAGYQLFLIGEYLMRSPDPAKLLEMLRT